MKRIQKHIYIILSILTALFFLFGQGVVWFAFGGDTEAYYINFGHHIEVKPLYPLFFYILKLIFGSELYLYAAAIIQMVIAVVCIMIFVHFLSAKLKLGTVSILLVWGASLLPFYLLLPEDPIPHVLMTESLTYPLLYVYVILLLKAIYDNDVKFFYLGMVFVVFMTLIRGQMLFLFPVTVMAYFGYLFVKLPGKAKDKVINFIKFLIVSFLLIKAGGLLAQVYEKVFFDAPAQDYSAQTVIQKALYCSDEKDTMLFKDEIEKEIFDITFAGMQEMKTTYQFDEGGLWSWKHITGSFGANSYLVQDVIEKVLSSHGKWPNDIIEQENQILKYSRQISNKLIQKNWIRCLKVSFLLMPAGFVSTVLFHKESIYFLIHIATAFLYLLAFVGSIIISKKEGRLLQETEYMWMALIIAVINVVSANIVHFGLQRYLAYTVGIFYVGLYLMLRRFVIILKKGEFVPKKYM